MSSYDTGVEIGRVRYDRSRYPVQPGQKKCRGCHGDVPKGRSTWCSDKCYDTYEPKRVRWFCQQRDKCVCQICGVDTQKMSGRYEDALHWNPPQQYRYLKAGVFQREKYDRAFAIAIKHKARWRAAAMKRVERMCLAGWPGVWKSWWEMDHIIPYSEGGLTVLNNVRTLCCLCHKQRTAKWRKERKKMVEQ